MQIVTAEGSAETQDWNFAGLGLGGGYGGGLGGYASTSLGKTVVASLIDAYNKMVAELRASRAG
jgi:hypothetical protein